MIDFQRLENTLKTKTGLSYYNSNRTELICRCPWCELQSIKNHGHLYIQVPMNKDQLPMFICFKCGDDSRYGRGTLLKLLRFIGEDVRQYVSKDILDRFKCRLLRYDYHTKSFKIHNYNVKKIDNSDRYILKKSYLKYRLGFDYIIENIPGLIFDIRDFVTSNKIDLGDKYRFLDWFEDSFIGFISTRGSTLLLRNIDATSKFRYFKFDLNPSDYFRDFYAIKTNNLKKNVNTIVLCEGIFDLLVSIKDYGMKEVLDKSCIWASILGKHFESVIPSILSYTKLSVANFIILSDKTKTNKNYKWFRNNVSVNSLEVYWNKNRKDFGEKPIFPVKTVIDNPFKNNVAWNRR